MSAQAQTITALSSDLATARQNIAAQASTLSNAASLLAIAPYVSLNTGAMNGVVGPNIVFQGVNIQMRSTTNEEDTSGTGNLIVGWDDPPGTLPVPYRSGSNNLVVGTQNNFTSNGGLVAGYRNTVSGLYASVSGGGYSTASGQHSSVSGGIQNTSGGFGSAVSGGRVNTASGLYATVSGGVLITASGTDDWGHP
jgi:hypothetical protein